MRQGRRAGTGANCMGPETASIILPGHPASKAPVLRYWTGPPVAHVDTGTEKHIEQYVDLTDGGQTTAHHCPMKAVSLRCGAQRRLYKFCWSRKSLSRGTMREALEMEGRCTTGQQACEKWNDCHEINVYLTYN